jgi:LysM repeat protein
LKKLTGTLLLQLFLLCSVSVLAQFQPTEVVRSQEKTIVDGKVYYIHTVLKGQTLYSISKVYEVTQDEIKNANPQVDVYNLREGLAIRIPDSKPRQIAVYPQNREDFIAHTVKRGQTVYSLSRKYDIAEEVIYYYNPWAREGIRPDQTIWIPRDKEMPVISETTQTNNAFYLYTIKEKDTLYSISKTYGVDVADIINANPELRNGLRPGQVIKIPRIETHETELIVDSDTLPAETLPCTAGDQGTAYEIALMLPFFASLQPEELELPVDSMAEEGTYGSEQRQQGLRGRYFAEFYEGFMLALDSLKKTGLS